MAGKRGPMTPEHKAAWLTSVRKSNNKPASAMPAAELGWGGSAGGAGSKRAKAPPITEPKAAASRAHTPAANAKRQATIASAEQLKCVLSEIALNENGPDMARIAAADKLLDRIEGKPTQSINATIRRTVSDFSDAELAAIAGEGSGEDGTGEEAHSTH